jgi:hypothetical protein
MSDSYPVNLSEDKWLKSIKCGCGECRFKDHETRGACPLENDPAAIWLWYLNPRMIGFKDYLEPSDFQPPAAFTEKEEEELLVPEVDQISPD